MGRDPSHDILFEPVKIGPVTTKNRFYQVPQCTGMGVNFPNSWLRHREIKAEGGWGVVCTEECSVHPTSDHSAAPNARLWCDDDLALLARGAEAVHSHGALFGIELAHAGKSTANRLTREHALAPSLTSYPGFGPYGARAMDLADIRELRRWHRQAAVKCRVIGADIVYVYCGHDLSIAMQFLCRRYNQRTDAYGGNLENRARLLRELLEDAHDAVGDSSAVALRFAVDELMGEDGLESETEGRELVEMLAELPDLWDVNLSDWTNDSGSSRFFDEGYQEDFTAFVKTITSKPVVGVGRYTSPDRMAALVHNGVFDLVGGARPSIADPFLPKKIEEGRVDDIRECIGCNICTTNEMLAVPIRCTQNATIGVEWSRGWHPEVFAPPGSRDRVLVVGAGPAGMECALTLGRRGYEVALAEAGTVFGGRVARERLLPGLAAWGRVADHRELQLGRLPNVEVYLDSALTIEHVLEFGAPRVVVATGAVWRRDGTGRQRLHPAEGWDQPHVYSADDVIDGAEIPGPVVIYDDDHYYIGSVLAELLSTAGRDVSIVTPAGEAATWTRFTLEWPHVQAQLARRGTVVTGLHTIAAVGADNVVARHLFSGKETAFPCASVVMVAGRTPRDELRVALSEAGEALGDAGIRMIDPIGDCVVPGAIVQAVFDGHRYARDLDHEPAHGPRYRVEPVPLANGDAPGSHVYFSA